MKCQLHHVSNSLKSQLLSDCVPIGVANKSVIPDKSFTASSSYDSNYLPHFARLNGSTYWATTEDDRDSGWLQIDLGKVYSLCAIATQGSSLEHNEWTIQYTVMLSLDGDSRETYQENGKNKASTQKSLHFISTLFYFRIEV